MAAEEFKSYVCNEFPYLIIGTAIPAGPGQHVVIAFGRHSAAGLYKARSHEEEKVIESNGWYGVKIFPWSDAPFVTEQPAAEPAEEPAAEAKAKKKGTK